MRHSLLNMLATIVALSAIALTASPAHAQSSCWEILEADPFASDGEYTIDLGGTPTQVWCDMTTDGGGWTLVARSSPSAWVAGNQDLHGLTPTGAPQPDPASAASFSYAFGAMDFGDFLFAAGDGSRWGVMARDDVWATNDDGDLLNAWVKASFGTSVVAGDWTNVRSAPWNLEDPWIGFEGSHSANAAAMMYGENSNGWHGGFRGTHGGVNIFVRPYCSGHGVVDGDGRTCVCGAGYGGLTCQGCDAGWSGEACDVCVVDVVCDDGNPCNGVETCDAGTCAAGTPLVCDDGVSCTDDACNPADGSCTYTADDANCANGDLCDGLETCDAVEGCQAGLPLACSDGDNCTTDFCDAAIGCDSTPILGCTGGTSCVDEAGSVAITAPFDNQLFPLGYDEWVPEESGDVTLSFTYTTFASDDTLVIYVDDVAAVTIPVAATHELVGLSDGSHTVAVFLADSTGKPYCGARDGVRFYLSRVCFDASECADDDPCNLAECIRDPSLTGWHGRCRFGPNTDDPDCCVNENWCAQDGLSFGDENLAYQCSDVDFDGLGDCVQCITDNDCWLTNPCQLGASCVANECVYARDPLCCEQDVDCDDGNACTTDTCGTTAANECDHTYIEDCCVPGLEDELPGANSYGCTAADATACQRFVCIGQGAAAQCREAQVFPQCCTEDTHCDQSRLLTDCVDPTGQGYAVCDTGTATEVPGAFRCDYSAIPTCCTHSSQCSAGYPAHIGTCEELGGDYDVCTYADNPDFCVSPVNALVISEIMVSTPLLGDPAGEWLEIFNPTATDVDIEGWYVGQDEAGTQEFQISTLAGSLIVPAGGFVTLAASSAAELNGGFEPDYVYDAALSGFQLDDVDAVWLFNALHETQDVVDWNLWLVWANSQSMALISPYLDNADQGNWARSKLVYGTQGDVDSTGTPGGPNRDVFDDALTTGGTCDDGNPCTYDLCNYDKAALCAHLPLFDCCLSEDSECNDYNVCTEDSCDGATFHCGHVEDPSCCLTDEDCVAVYPDEFDTVAEQLAFNLCTDALCIGGQCRFGRDSSKPGCCVTTDAGLGLGCSDRNTCTTDLCADGGGGYALCSYDTDPLDDPDEADGDECCFTSAECDDGDPATIDMCSRVPLGENPNCLTTAQSQCCNFSDPLYCADDSGCDDGLACTTNHCCDGTELEGDACFGQPANQCLFEQVGDTCCESHANCADGDGCTVDYCCVGFGDAGLVDELGDPIAVPECLAANTCAHPAVEGDAVCCASSSECTQNVPFRTGYCVGGVCRYGAPNSDPVSGAQHCLLAADCALFAPTDSCVTWECNANLCVANPLDDCCQQADDCPTPAAACKVAACQAGACIELDVPNCCEDLNGAAIPDESCLDADPCTTDYCMDVGNKFQCRHYKTGGASCCATSATCPDDQVQCTVKDCSGDNACELVAEADCQLFSPYEMSFDEGHAVYAGQYLAVTDLGWALAETGTQPLDAASWGFDAGGLLGVDQYLRLLPVGHAADFESCLVLPTMSTLGGFWWAELSFSYAADVMGAGAAIELRVSIDGDWANATVWGQPIAIGADIGETAYTTGHLPLPQALANNGSTQFAICVLGTDSDLIFELNIDDVELEKFNSQ